MPFGYKDIEMLMMPELVYMCTWVAVVEVEVEVGRRKRL